MEGEQTQWFWVILEQYFGKTLTKAYLVTIS